MNNVKKILVEQPFRWAKTRFDRLWDWTAYQLTRGLHWTWKYLEKPYDLLKLFVLWSLLVLIGLGLVFSISMMIYLFGYYFAVVPPAVVSLDQELNLKYPDPSVLDYIYAYHCLSPVTYPHSYNWRLKLRLPESPDNFNAGVFMAKLLLLPPSNEDSINSDTENLSTQQKHQRQWKTGLEYRFQNKNSTELFELQKSSVVGERALMLRWKPQTYRWINTVVYSIPKMISEIFGFNWFEEAQILEIDLVKRHLATPPQQQKSAPTHQCFIFTINNQKVQIYDAKIQVTVILEGLKYYAYYWFWTCFFIGSTLIFVLIVSLISTYLAIRLIVKVMNGEITIPSRFSGNSNTHSISAEQNQQPQKSKEEIQMEEMRATVAELLKKKAHERQTKSIDSTKGSDAAKSTDSTKIFDSSEIIDSTKSIDSTRKSSLSEEIPSKDKQTVEDWNQASDIDYDDKIEEIDDLETDFMIDPTFDEPFPESSIFNSAHPPKSRRTTSKGSKSSSKRKNRDNMFVDIMRDEAKLIEFQERGSSSFEQDSDEDDEFLEIESQEPAVASSSSNTNLGTGND